MERSKEKVVEVLLPPVVMMVEKLLGVIRCRRILILNVK